MIDRVRTRDFGCELPRTLPLPSDLDRCRTLSVHCRHAACLEEVPGIMGGLLEKVPVGTLFSNPLNLALLAILLYTSYPLLPSLKPSRSGQDQFPSTPTAYNWMPAKFPEALVWRTYTPLELRSWDGREGKRIVSGLLHVAIRR